LRISTSDAIVVLARKVSSASSSTLISKRSPRRKDVATDPPDASGSTEKTKPCCSASRNCLKRAWALDLRTICELELVAVSARLPTSPFVPGTPGPTP